MAKCSAGSQRLYRFVYWHRAAKIWVWHRKGHAAHGQHANQHQAAKLAAAAFNIPVARLRLPSARQQQQRQLRPLRMYQHVHYHTRSRTWVAQRSGRFLGSSTSQPGAAMIASKALNVPLSKLRLPKPRELRPALLLHKQRFQLMWAIYRQNGTSAKLAEAKVPGDLEQLFHSSQAKEMLDSCPELLMPYILAKYGPHRDALAASAAELAGQRAQTPPPEWLHKVLQGTMLRLSGTILSDAWILNVGSGVTFHSGLVPFVHCSLRMLRPCAKGAKGVLRLGNLGRSFRLINRRTALMEKRLTSVVNFGHAMASAKAPRNTEQWAAEVQKLQEAAKGTAGLQGPAAYRTLWVIRAWLMYLMRQAKVPHLELSAACTVTDFAKLFPDNKAWIFKFAGRGKRKKLMAEVLADLGRPSL